MKFLVTGGAGFIGSHLCEALIARGDDVVAIDNFSTGEVANLAGVEAHERFKFEHADEERAEGQIERLAEDCDVIIHLAAAVGVQKIIDEPVKTLETNVDYAQVVLRAAVKNKTRILIASTSEVYGRSQQELFSEGDDLLIGPPQQSRWGYAASKLVDEFLALAYFREYELPVTIMRLFNTVGPRQTGRYGMVIPRFVKCALAGEPLSVFGDGKQRRTFTSVDQVIKAMLELVECQASLGEIVNIGGTAEISISELADRIIEMCQSSSAKQLVPYEEAYGATFEDMRRRNPNTAKLRKLIGWAPELEIRDILQPIIDDARAQNSDILA